MLDLKANTALNQAFGIPPVALEQPVSFDLGSGLSLDSLIAAASDGSADGLFATNAFFDGTSSIGTLPVRFVLDLAVTNGATPPLFDADLSEIKGANQKTRVPGAVEAGPNVKTGYWKCLIFPLCVFVSTDVPQDFPVAAQTEVVVPAEAQYLVLAPLSPAYKWSDNSGFSFGVDVTVDPTP